MNVVDELRAVLSDGGVVVDEENLDSYRRDQAGLVPDGAALAAVFPTSTAQVAKVIRLAGRHRVPVVARGAGELAGAALNVLPEEPPPEDHRLLRRREVLLTPHVAWYSTRPKRNYVDAQPRTSRIGVTGGPCNQVTGGGGV